MTFCPILKTTIWGGERIKSFKGLNSSQKLIGESWELSGISGSESVIMNGELAGLTITELLKKYGADLVGKANYARFGNEFPLLIKLIDAHEDLSIQVHPNDEIAYLRHKSRGKTEMWYVIDADNGAKLRSGFSHKVTTSEYLKNVENNTITDILQESEVKPGDVFFLPAGRIHSIGAGCFIAEIQQTSNITYRIFDFNRTDSTGNQRELHTAEALDVIDFSFKGNNHTLYNHSLKNKDVKLIQSPYFTSSILNLTSPTIIHYNNIDSFVIYICVEGSAEINGTTISCGQTILLPASTSNVIINNAGCKLLTAYIDPLQSKIETKTNNIRHNK